MLFNSQIFVFLFLPAVWLCYFGLHTIKLSYSGGHSADIRNILNDVFESKNEVKYILLDVNDYQLTSDKQ